MKLNNLKQRLIPDKIDKLKYELQIVDNKYHKLAYQKTWLILNPIVEINLISNRRILG